MAEVVVVNKLKPYYERLQNLEEQRKEISEMMKEVFAECKAEGFDVAALKRAMRDLNKDPEDVSNFEETVQLYRDAIS